MLGAAQIPGMEFAECSVASDRRAFGINNTSARVSREFLKRNSQKKLGAILTTQNVSDKDLLKAC